MPTIRFNATLTTIGSSIIVTLPKSASAKLPSRGMAMADGIINGFRCQIPLEPDGKGSHWFRVDSTMLKSIGADAGDTLALVMMPATQWPDPPVPPDVQKAFAADRRAYEVWIDTTPAARWDWIRWIRATKNAETRKRRIEVACSKLRSGERRPCCFNRNMCTEPDVSKNGVLIEPM